MENGPLITNDAIVLGILTVILGAVFWTSSQNTPFWKKFYTFVPSLLLCYFIPSLLSTMGLISGEASSLYHISSRYLLPTSLVLLTLSIDLKGVLRLGPKAVILFLTGTTGVVVGGPLAILIVASFNPEYVGGQGVDAVWRGLTTVAGSWIGGGANQTAMKEVFEVGDQIFSALVAVDVIVASVWMAVLLYAAGRSEAIDGRTGADTSAITELRSKVEQYHAEVSRIPRLTDTMLVLAVGLGVTAFSHLVASGLKPAGEQLGGIAGTIKSSAPQLAKFSLTSPFFWLIVCATTIGLLLSFTPARQLEGVGASRVGSAMLYILVASIGMKMDLMAIFENPQLFLVGAIWIAFHAILLITVAWLIKAPVFFMAVGSQANIGGAASAPIVASAFHPALAPVGVLLAVLGYALGTYAAWFCGQLMRMVAP
jgi:uncharacterized membrane protein